MNIGDYVRTKNGKIIKVGEEELYDINLDSIKSSPNIIDLIEVGDYVNGKEVLELKNFGAFNGARVFGDIYFNEDIKSIVTREMFESMEYKIGE